MKQKNYEKPTMQVVKLQQAWILQTSVDMPAMPDYPDGDDPFDDPSNP